VKYAGGEHPRRSAHRLRQAHPRDLDDGRITPEEALVQASSILKKHFEPFYGYDENAVQFDETPQAQNQENQKLKKLLNMSVNEIELSVRAAKLPEQREHHERRSACAEERSRDAQVPQLRQEVAQRNQGQARAARPLARA
jgi:DNA-directed RNA polymerase alpha subunit